MKIKKNGKVINLTESDLRRIVKKVIKEQDEKVPLKTFTISAQGGKSPKTGKSLPGPFNHKVQVRNSKMKDKEGKTVTDGSRYEVRVDGKAALAFEKTGDIVQTIKAGWNNLDVYAKGVIMGMAMKDLYVPSVKFGKGIQAKDTSFNIINKFGQNWAETLKNYYTDGNESLKLSVS
jgi:hypothetical protein